MKLFFVTDLHGSEICWKKFLNAGPFYGADVVILGGDVTGKAMVPIVQRSNGSWDASLQDHLETIETEAEIVEFEKRVMNRGYYPIRVSQEEYVAMQEDADLVDKRFKEVMLDGTERWIAMAEDKLAGTGIRVVACPANDDMFEIDELLTHANVVETGDEDHPIELDGFTMISMGWTNPTPWHTSVKEAIERFQPMLGLHGHIHESKGATRIGSTLSLNPGSSYEEGILQAAVVTIDPKKRKVKNYQLVNG